MSLDAVALSSAIKSRQISCVEVMRAHLEKIARINPRVNAIVSLQPFEDLIVQAEKRDEQLARGEYLGWMHGFPHAVKDLEVTKDIRTTMGSLLFKDFIPKADSIVVERMKDSGAIVIGKTNVPEFGLGSQTYNPVFGTTLNAYDQTKTAGGSSGGTAVALALRMLPVWRRQRFCRFIEKSSGVQQCVWVSTLFRPSTIGFAGTVQRLIRGDGTDGANGAGFGDAAIGNCRIRRTRTALDSPGSGCVRTDRSAVTSRARGLPGWAISAVTCHSNRAYWISAKAR